MWCDNFDADLLAVVPGALEALGEAADVKLFTYSTLTAGKINCPAAWNTHYGLCSLFWTAPEHQPDRSWSTDKPVVECTFAEAVRDEWVHSCSIDVNGAIIWTPPTGLMEKLMFDLRNWRRLGDKEREQIRTNVRRSLAVAAGRRCTTLLGGYDEQAAAGNEPQVPAGS